MLIKAGVDISRLRPQIRKKLSKIAMIINMCNEGEMVVTSTYEGNHSESSLHYAHLAVDIRKNVKRSQSIKEIRRELGTCYDVIEYETYFHIEYDPK